MNYWKNIKDVESYSPKGHSGTKNKRIVGKKDGMEDMEVIIGEIAPGGLADPHYHEEIEQAMYILSGKMHVKINNQESTLSAGNVVIIPKNAMHEVTNPGEDPVRFVLIYSPPFNKQ